MLDFLVRGIQVKMNTLLVLTLCSALGAKDVQNNQERVATLTDEAQQQLDATQIKTSTKTVQLRANSLYDELELELVHYKNQPQLDSVLMAKADRILFNLSKNFNLKTPAKNLAQHLKNIAKTCVLQWERTGKHVTQTDLSDRANKEPTVSILEYIRSESPLGITKIFPMARARKFVKDIFLVLGFVQASPLNQQRVADALKNVGYLSDTIVLENPDPKSWYSGKALQVPFFDIIILASKDFNDAKFDEFAVYHEIGHLYHSHIYQALINRPLSIILNILLFDAYLATPLFDRLKTAPDARVIASSFLTFLIKLIYILTESFPAHREREREADLFACNQLVKQGRVHAFYDELYHKQISTSEHHELTYQIWPYLTQTHPSLPETKRYLVECLKSHGVGGPYLESCTACTRGQANTLLCSCTNGQGTTLESSIKLPCHEEIVNRGGQMVCELLRWNKSLQLVQDIV